MAEEIRPHPHAANLVAGVPLDLATPLDLEPRQFEGIPVLVDGMVVGRVANVRVVRGAVVGDVVPVKEETWRDRPPML